MKTTKKNNRFSRSVYVILSIIAYAWNKLNTVIKKERGTYLITTVLFSIWHLGGIESIAFRVETGLAKIMFWKVIVGLVYGIVLGALRLKTKNSYSTILLHGVMNIFGK